MIPLRLFSYATVVLIGLAANAALVALGEAVENPSMTFHAGVGDAIPLVELPAKVPAEEGMVTLWADFEGADDKGVPLYLVNKTGVVQNFDSEDRDIYLKLEYKDVDGRWKYAQGHRRSWCGNSYFSVALPASQYFKFYGYRAAEGSVQEVRYASKIRNSLVSNVGKALISQADLDQVVLSGGGLVPVEIMQVLHAFGAQEPLVADAPSKGNPSIDDVQKAVRGLMFFPEERSVMELVRKLKAKALLLPDGGEKAALLSAINEVLVHDFPKEAPDKTILDVCLDRLAASEGGSDFITEEFAWRRVNSALASKRDLLPDQLTNPHAWKPLIAPAVKSIESSDKAVSYGAPMALLNTGWIIDAVVPNAEVMSWTKSPSMRLQDIGARTLVRRSLFAELVKIARDMPKPSQLQILKALAFNGIEWWGEKSKVRHPELTEEREFWADCMATMPVESANALWSPDFRHNGNPFNRWVHDPLKRFWEIEAKTCREAKEFPARDDQLLTALKMLASFKMGEDDSLFEEMLHHGGYVLQNSYRDDPATRGTSSRRMIHIVSRQYVFRKIAREALIARGEPVPPNVVLEEPVSETEMKN